MSSKPTVVLTLAGDEAKLTDAFNKVGDSAKDMAGKVGGASKDMQDSGRSMDDLAEKAGTGEQRFIGFKDSITGTQDILTGFREGDLLTTAQGFADLAGGLESFVIPALASFGGALKGLGVTLVTSVIPAVWAFTASLLANPITWIVLGVVALIAAIVLLIVHWDKVKAAIGVAVDWIRDRWNGLMNWFQGIPGWFGRIFASVGDAIAGAFKSAINWVIDRLNWFVDRANDIIHGINIISPFEDIRPIPHIPRLHTGGIVPGMPGQESLALLQAGERVIPAGQSGGGGTLRVIVSGSGGLAELFHHELRTGGVQLEVDGQPVRVVA